VVREQKSESEKHMLFMCFDWFLFLLSRLMGKVASDKCHKWVFKEPTECEPNISNYWQSSFDAVCNNTINPLFFFFFFACLISTCKKIGQKVVL
jgi:hypothetical protein